MYDKQRQRANKVARRSYLLEVQDHMDWLQDDEIVHLDFHDNRSASQTDHNEILSNQIVELNDLMKSASSKTRKKSRKLRKVETKPSESYETPTSIALKQNHTHDECDKTFHDIHNLSVDCRQFISDLRREHPQFHFSRLGCSLRGSIKVICNKFKVAWVSIWTSYTKGYDIKLVPFVNCSELPIKTLNKMSKKVCKVLTQDFQNEIKGVKYSKNPTEERFRILSSFVVNYGTEKHLSDILDCHCAKRSTKNPMRQTLEKFNLDVKTTLDYFDIAVRTFVQEKTDLSSNEICDAEVIDDFICPICYDEYEDNDVQLMTCGHKACRSCWQGLIRSSTSSGDTKILCPAYKCRESLTLSDITHVLFERCETVTDEDTQALMKLTEFKIDDILLERKYTRCSTLSCTRLLRPTSKCLTKLSSEIKCDSLCLCDCGAITCGECAQPAHFGLSCEAAKRVRKEIATGHMNAELQSLLWVHENTSPCPRCSFPIRKNGGCNHVRCSKCDYYFCWICGGPGSDCRSFQCQKTGILTWGKEDNASYDDRNIRIKNQMTLIKNLYRSVQKVEALSKNNVDGFHSKDRRLALEFKLRNLIMWMYGIALDKSVYGVDIGNKKGPNMMDEIKSLELMVNYLDGNPNSMKSTIIAQGSYANHSSTKNVTKKKKSSKKKAEDCSDDDVSFNIVIQTMKLQTMNSRQLDGHIASECQNAMGSLINLGRVKTSKKDKSSKETNFDSTNSLNKRKSTSNVPWKSERRFLDFLDDTETRSKKKARVPWKGKVKVATRRNLALLLSS